MAHYSLVFAADAQGRHKVVCFDALDAADALLIAHRETKGFSAELWKDHIYVCAIRRTDVDGDDIWEIR
jgi:hypothetical protein